MKSSVISKYDHLSRRKKFTTRAIAILGALILLITALTFYGTQTGNFVISVKNLNRNESIMLSMSEDSTDLTSRIVAKPLKDCIDGCYADIPDEIEEGLGSKNDDQGRYLAISFYLINNGTTARNFTMDFKITSVTKNVDTILRVMVIQDGEKSFYSKAKENDEGSEFGEPIRGITSYGLEEIQKTVAFSDETTILFREFKDFEVGTKKKFTIVMWLDGFDDQNPDNNREMLGGALKTDLKFSITG
jgi:hypothetical protein